MINAAPVPYKQGHRYFFSSDPKSPHYARRCSRKTEYLYRDYFPHIWLQGNFSIDQILSASEVEKKAQKVQAQRTWRRRLGISVNKFSALDPVTAKLPAFVIPAAKKSDRQRRYMLQEAIRINHLVDANIQTCGRVAVAKNVGIGINTQSGVVGYKNVHTCKSVWGCPVCRKRIMERRGEMAENVFVKAQQRNLYVYHITLTVRHHNNDNLARLYGRTLDRSGITGAIARMRGWRGFRKIKNQLRYVCDWRTIEVTYSKKNGFHPHIHMMLIAEKKQDPKIIESEILNLWKKATYKAGLKQVNYAGCRVVMCNNKETASYSLKWGLSTEITSDHKTGAKSGNFTLYDIENMLIDPGLREMAGFTMQQVTRVLGIFYGTMKGCKLMQSAGDKKLLKEVQAETDKQAAAAVENQEIEQRVSFGYITSEDFSKLVKSGQLNRLKDWIELIYEKKNCLITCGILLKKFLYKYGIRLIPQLE